MTIFSAAKYAKNDYSSLSDFIYPCPRATNSLVYIQSVNVSSVCDFNSGSIGSSVSGRSKVTHAQSALWFRGKIY